ncbi:MAG: zf-HC2 domain-containing protein [Aggregatilineales bacterium]
MTFRTPEEFELLSAYLDNALTARQRQALEARLTDSADLRAQLADLRAMRALLRKTPTLQPPRDFRLEPATYARTAWWARLGTLRLTSALSAAAAVLLIALGALLGNLPSVPMQSIALQATEPPTLLPAQAAELSTPTSTAIAPDAAPLAPPLTLEAMSAATFVPTTPPELGFMMATEAPSDIAKLVPPTTAPPEPTPQAAAEQGAPAALSPVARLAILVGIALLIISGVLLLIATFQRRL